MSKIQAVIALGSNLGESSEMITSAAERIASTPGIELLALSSIYTSKPAVVLEQPDFKNAVMLVETSLSPRELLCTLQKTEADFGRVREGEGYIPGGPRTLDLDIIDIEGIVLDDPRLTLPHPETLRRAFVVTPLLEISPYHVLANNKVVNENAVDCGELVTEQGTADDSDTSDEESSLPNEGKNNSGSHSGSRSESWSDSHSGSRSGSWSDSRSDSYSGSHSGSHSGMLSICATPIGNLGDITLRALETLQAADAIYCEDTRVTRKLTARYDIKTSLHRADAHKLPELLPALLAKLEEGKHLAYVSDAGMPGISDPGGTLVSAAREAGYAVEVLPGASALTTALATSGIKAHNHYFGGFFPRKTGAGKRLLESVADLEDTALVFYESVHRTAKTLRLIAEVLPTRHVVMARELTKLHEEVLSGAVEDVAANLTARIAQGQSLKGEVVLLIAPRSALS